MKLIECVPNFSEGRRPDVIQAIADRTQGAGGHILDVHSDADHNRTVITFVGTPEQVEAAAYVGIVEASRLIDMRAHNGVHPRVGSADVVPLVPLTGVTDEECVEIAWRLARRVGSEINLPVYLYGKAQQSRSRRLADIRRGGYEALQARIESDPIMQPDYGSKRVGSAGAVVIGVRAPLIAFNVYLDTADVHAARQIARVIRESGGGLPHLQAMGVLVKGQAQVSMNLLDYRQTSLHDVFEAAKTQAKEHGVSISRSELVGLAPEEALGESDVRSLGLPDAARSQTIEHRLLSVSPNETLTLKL